MSTIVLDGFMKTKNLKNYLTIWTETLCAGDVAIMIYMIY